MENKTIQKTQPKNNTTLKEKTITSPMQIANTLNNTITFKEKTITSPHTNRKHIQQTSPMHSNAQHKQTHGQENTQTTDNQNNTHHNTSLSRNKTKQKQYQITWTRISYQYIQHITK